MAAQPSRVPPRLRPVPLWWLGLVELRLLPWQVAARPLLAVEPVPLAVVPALLARPVVARRLPALLVPGLPVVELLAVVPPGLLVVVLDRLPAVLARVEPVALVLVLVTLLRAVILLGLLRRLMVSPVLLTVARVTPGSAAQPVALSLPARAALLTAARIPLGVLLGVLPQEDLAAVARVGRLRPGHPRPVVALALAVPRLAVARVDLAWTPGLRAALNPPALVVPGKAAPAAALPPRALHQAPAATLAESLADRLPPRHRR